MVKGVLTLILALVLFASGYQNENMEVRLLQETAQNVLQNPAAEELDGYMEAVNAQSDAIRASLEQDVLTQMEMNEKSQELYVLWDAAMNHLLEAAERSLPETEYAALAEEQQVWLLQAEQAVQEAGKEFEGGSIHALIVNSEAADLAQARACELYEMLQGISL